MSAQAIATNDVRQGTTALRLLAPVVIALSLVFGACTMTETEQRTATGAGIGAMAGAAGGALFGAMFGVPGTGAAIGAAAGTAIGAGTGYVVDQRRQRQDAQAEAARMRAERDAALRQQQQQ